MNYFEPTEQEWDAIARWMMFADPHAQWSPEQCYKQWIGTPKNLLPSRLQRRRVVETHFEEARSRANGFRKLHRKNHWHPYGNQIPDLKT